MHYKVTAVAEGGPAHDILKVDDRIVQVRSLLINSCYY